MTRRNPVPLAEPSPVAGRSLWQDAWLRLRRNRAAVASAVVLLLLALAGIFGPMSAPHPYDRVYPQYVRAPASLEAYPARRHHPAGLRARAGRAPGVEHGDAELDGGDGPRGRSRSDEPIDPRIVRYFDRSDLFSNPRSSLADGRAERRDRGATCSGCASSSAPTPTAATCSARIMIGIRISLAIGVLASVMALVLGVTYGAIAGYLGGRVDNVMMRVVDILYSLPFIFFVILLVVFFGRSFVLIFIAIGCTEWLDMARIVRGQTLTLKRQEFVQAAEALGVDQCRHPAPPHHPQHARAGRRLRDAAGAQGDPAGKPAVLPRPRRAGAADQPRPADLGRRGQHARRALAADLSRR